MRVEFADADPDRLETDASFTMGFAVAIVRAYRMGLQAIRSARDERDLRAMKAWRFEKLKGRRAHQHSLRLNDQFRLVFEIVGTGSSKGLRIVGIEDYH